MKPIAILQHNAGVPSGFLGEAIAAAGLPSRLVRLYESEPLPELAEVSAIVSLGGIMGAYEEDQHAFLAPEKVLLRQAVEKGTPVLGLCLGCQLLADALGGRAYRGVTHEVEFGPLEVTDEGKEDPIIRTLAEPVLSFHGDTFEPPPGVTILATSSLYPHAFRHGSATAIQAHPEAGSGILRRWVERYGRERLHEEGVDSEALLAAVEEADSAAARRAAELFGVWLGEAVATQR
jgi:GMP synthase (glutamine-hydrolysing)